LKDDLITVESVFSTTQSSSFTYLYVNTNDENYLGNKNFAIIGEVPTLATSTQ
jgi:hypothetical protein